MSDFKMKTPVTYYGGKQTMLKYILPLIPEHTIYTEAYAGGAAVFFAKQPANTEILNDTNGELINFYRVFKQHSSELKDEINSSVHSRNLHTYAKFIYSYPEFFSKVKRAWALWYLSKTSFASKLDGSYGYDKTPKNTCVKRFVNGKEYALAEQLANRLSNVQLESNDGVRVILSRDSVNAFHFIDTPYPGSNQGHYSGFSDSDFERVLMSCEQITGKFMLTMFPHDILQKYINKHGWNVKEITRTISASKTSRRKQVELIVMNY